MWILFGYFEYHPDGYNIIGIFWTKEEAWVAQELIENEYDELKKGFEVEG